MACKLAILVPWGLLLLAAAPIFGHHSVSAEFDVNRQITYAGVVTRVEWSNPHIYFYVDVKDANEKVTNWAFEGAGPNTLARLGWMRDSLKVGDRVTVVAFPARDGAAVASAREVRLANGRKVLAGMPPEPPAALNEQWAFKKAELPRGKELLQKRLVRMTTSRIAAQAAVIFLIAGAMVWGAVTGKVAGTVTDQSGASIPMVSVKMTNTAQGLEMKVTADEHGDFIFPSVPVGTYDILFEAKGFRSEKRTALVVDTNADIQQNMTLQLAQQTQELTVSDTATDVEVHVETASTQMGDVVVGKTMTEVALNGRSFTDLLALQPGIVPMSTQTGDSVIMAGASVQIAPSGGLNAGNQSISGQREDANGYLVNGGDVKELMNGGTTIIPNLDSIAEFRVLTNNFDAEFGNYSGGIVNVITKSGANQIHGSGFEFLRNTDLDARNFFSPERSFYRQNQFGGTVGGPIRKNKIFYFGDYQGTRSNQGIDTGLIAVPSLAERTGDLSSVASQLTGIVSGPYIANILQQRLGYGVTASEPYYTSNCTSNIQCVFPNAIIPTRAWSAPAQHLLQYIPQPNVGSGTFSTGSVWRDHARRQRKLSLRRQYRPFRLIFGLLFL